MIPTRIVSFDLGPSWQELDRNNNGNISIQEFKVLRALNATEDRLPHGQWNLLHYLLVQG